MLVQQRQLLHKCYLSVDDSMFAVDNDLSRSRNHKGRSQRCRHLAFVCWARIAGMRVFVAAGRVRAGVSVGHCY
jgi:hypothetical protein